MYSNLLFRYAFIILGHDARLSINLAQTNKAIQPLLESVIMADHKQLIETAHAVYEKLAK